MTWNINTLSFSSLENTLILCSNTVLMKQFNSTCIVESILPVQMIMQTLLKRKGRTVNRNSIFCKPKHVKTSSQLPSQYAIILKIECQFQCERT